MFFLIWHISPYTSHDWTLGVFTTEELAESAKANFISFLNIRGNPFAKQAYHKCDLERDIYITAVEKFSATIRNNRCMIVFEYLDCLGQCKINPIYLASGEKDAKRFAKKFNKDVDFNCSVFAENCIIDKLYDLGVYNRYKPWQEIDEDMKN